jgi:hypothetical protein
MVTIKEMEKMSVKELKSFKKTLIPIESHEFSRFVVDYFIKLHQNIDKLKLIKITRDDLTYDIKNIINKWYWNYFESSCDCKACKTENEETLKELMKDIDKLKLRGEI